ncbi:MAG: hypothetical protein AB1500_12180 [Bacillota bacterium]
MSCLNFSYRYQIIILFIIFILFLGGCGTPKTDSKPFSSGEPIAKENSNMREPARSQQLGWLYKSDYETIFIRWVETDKNLVGQLQLVKFNGKDATSETHAFNGIRNGSDISITFSGSIWVEDWSGITWTGSLKGNELTLVFPCKDGTLGTIIFKPGSVEDYNEAVLGFQNQADTIAALEALQQKQEQVRKELLNIFDELNENTSELASISFNDVVSEYQAQLEEMQSDFTKLRQDATVQPFNSYQLGVVQYDLGVLDYHLGCYDYHTNSYERRVDSIRDSQSRINSNISSLQMTWKNYHNLCSSYNDINSQDIALVINAARKEVSNSELKIEEAQKQVTSYHNQAQQLYQTASSFVAGLKPIE